MGGSTGVLGGDGPPMPSSQATGLQSGPDREHDADESSPNSASRSRASPSPRRPSSRRTPSSRRSSTTSAASSTSPSTRPPSTAPRSSRRRPASTTAISRSQNDAQREQALRNFAERRLQPDRRGRLLARQRRSRRSPTEFPDTKFAIIDMVVDLPNVHSIVFKEHEGSLLVGMLAAHGLQDRQGRLRRRHGHPADPQVRLRLRAGRQVRQARRRGVPEHDRHHAARPGTIRSRAASSPRAQIDRGADVVYHAAGGTGLGVLQAAADAGKLGIGVDSQPERPASRQGADLDAQARRRRRPTTPSRTAKDGTFKPGVTVLGLTEDGVGWALDDNNKALITAGDEGRGRRGRGRHHRRATIKVHDYMADNDLPGLSDRAAGRHRADRGDPAPAQRPCRRPRDAARRSSCRHRQALRRRPRQPGHRPRRRARHDPRHRRRERRRQVDADVDPLRLLPGRLRRDPRRRQADGDPRPPGRDRGRHRHGAPALHAGRALHRARERHARRRGRRRCCRPALAKARARAASGSSATTASRSIPTRVVGELPVGLQQRVEILKALYRGADILILDEPTGVLTPPRPTTSSASSRSCKEQGKTIILITHKLREIMAVTDHVSVMRRGEMVATRRDGGDLAASELAELMVGRRVLLRVEKGAGAARRDACSRSRTSTSSDGRGVAARRRRVASTSARGEIVGIAGVAGNGQSRAARGARRHPPAGARARSCSTGKPIAVAATRDPHALRRLGLAHVPEDRLRMGLVIAFEACENAILGYHDEPRYGTGRSSIIDARSSTTADGKMEQYDVRPPTPRLKTANFSGGNQQKIVLAREIERDPERAARRPADARRRYRRHRVHPPPARSPCATRGKAILLVSVELDEILLALRPHPGHVRRPHHRRARRRRGRRARARPADGRRSRRRHDGTAHLPSSRSASPTSPARAPSTRRWGWKASSASQPEVVFFQANGLALALWGRADLAEDAGVEDRPTRLLAASRSPITRARRRRPTRSSPLAAAAGAQAVKTARTMSSGAAIRAISPIPTGISGRWRGIRPSRSTRTAISPCRRDT